MNIKTLTKFATPVVLGASASAAMAGTGGSEFSDVATLLEEWSQGVLGKILALGALIVGIAFGLVRQSVVAAVIGISMCVILYYGPTVIDGIMSATTDAAVSQIAQFSNGLFSETETKRVGPDSSAVPV